MTPPVKIRTGQNGSFFAESTVFQNRILRAICKAGFHASVDPIYQRLKLLKLEENYRYLVGAYVFKTSKSDRPCVFEYRDQTNYVTRESVLALLEALG